MTLSFLRHFLLERPLEGRGHAHRRTLPPRPGRVRPLVVHGHGLQVDKVKDNDEVQKYRMMLRNSGFGSGIQG